MNLLDRAEEMGRIHGEAHADWYFDGNTKRETYERVLKGIEDGDPEILDSFPSGVGALSGEWADDPTPTDVFDQLGVEPDEEGNIECATCGSKVASDDLLIAYEEAFDAGVQDYLVQQAKKALAS